MTPYEFGRASANFVIGIVREAATLQGQACSEGHLFLTFCACDDCCESMAAGYLPGITCTLCGEYFDEYEDEDEL